MWGTDDRGNRVKAIAVYTLVGPGAIWCPLPRSARKAVFAEALHRTPVTELGFFFAAAALSLIGAQLVIEVAALLAGYHWTLNVARLILVVGCLVGLFRIAAQRACYYVTERIVSHGHCATCGHLLEGLPTDHIRRVTCPECGSAWRINAPFGKRSS